MRLYELRNPLGRSGEKYDSKIKFKNIGRLFILLSEGENGITKWNFPLKMEQSSATNSW